MRLKNWLLPFQILSTLENTPASSSPRYSSASAHVSVVPSSAFVALAAVAAGRLAAFGTGNVKTGLVGQDGRLLRRGGGDLHPRDCGGSSCVIEEEEYLCLLVQG